MSVNSDLNANEEEAPAKLGSDLVKCSRCACTFFTQHDLNLHKAICEERLWRESIYDDRVKIALVEDFPNIAHACKINKTVKNGLYEYTLSADGRRLKRKHI